MAQFKQARQQGAVERLIGTVAGQGTGRVEFDDIDLVKSAFAGFVADPKKVYDGDLEKTTGILATGMTTFFNVKKFLDFQIVKAPVATIAAFVGAGYSLTYVTGVIEPKVGVYAGLDEVFIAPPLFPGIPVRSVTLGGVGPFPSPIRQHTIITCGCGGGSGGGGGGGGGSPAAPSIVQAQQEVVLAEVNEALSNATFAGFAPATVSTVLDKDRTTTIVHGAGAGSFSIIFKQSLLLGRIVVLGSVTGLTMTLVRPNLTTFVPIAAVTNANGVDSGNFTPTEVVRIDVAVTGATTIGEVQARKVIETKGEISLDMSNFPGEPIFTQDRQQVTNEEATVTLGGAFVGSGPSVLDKDTSTFITSPGVAPATITVGFTAGALLISRVAVQPGPLGVLGTTVAITVTPVSGPAVTVFSRAGAGVTAGGIDSLNFEPILATTVTVTFAVAGTDYDVSEVIILKTHEVKSASNLNPLVTSPYFSSGAAFVGGNTRYADGDAFTTPDAIGAVAARFVEVGKDQQPTITAQSRIVAGGGVTTYSIFLDWYFSFDGVTWFYGGSSVISDTAAAGNPTGFLAAAGTSERAVAKPVNIYGRFIALVARHLSGAGLNSVTLTAVLNRQR